MLDAWASSPTRFREDANSEEDLVLGGYRDRWFVELAQNAADAAARAGVPGRLRVSVVDGELRAANTGEPLSAAGVSSLASLRASAKRDSGVAGPSGVGPSGVGVVGRFGVGFAAVLAVCDAPRVVSRTGGVRFSEERTLAALAGLPTGVGVHAELARRCGRVPVLRLPWPVPDDEAPLPAGLDTEVRLPLRPGLDPAELTAAALAQAPDLLLALPALAVVEVAGRELARSDVGSDRGSLAVLSEDGRERSRWRLLRRGGHVPAGPAGTTTGTTTGTAAEDRPEWTVTWAAGPVGTEEVLHAPTPTDERLSLPARLFATLPLEPSRRRVRPGPVTDHVLAAAAAVYVELVAALPPEERAGLVPLPALPASDVDAVLRDGVLAALRAAAWLPAAAGGEVTPAAAVALDLAAPPGLARVLADLLADVVPGLLAPPGPPPPVLAALGVARLGPAALVERLAGLTRPPSWWHALYAALDPAARADRTVREELAGLPVPLAEGRVVLGPHTCLLPGPGAPEVVPRLRIVHPDAAHPLLALLGAREVGPADLLDDPALAEAVERSVDDAEAGLDVAPLAEAVLGLVAAISNGGPGGVGAGSPGGDRPWLAGLALPDAVGDPRRADELLLPDAALHAVLEPDSPLGVLAADVAARYPREALLAVGVLDGFAVLVDEQPAGADHDLAGEEEWWAQLPEPPARLLAVRDLDLVDPARWPAALALLGTDPAARAALAARPGEPVPYTSWWLARHAVLGGCPPRHWRLPSAEELAGLLDPVPVDLDERLLAAIGVRERLEVADAADAVDLLARLADPQRRLDAAVTRAAHAALAAAVADDRFDAAAVDSPSRVRTLDGTVADAADAAVLDREWLGEALTDPLVAGGDPEALAELLDLPLASERVRGSVVSTGRATPWAALPEVAAACEAIGVHVPAGSLVLHGELTVALHEPRPARRSVPVWVDDAGRVHAADPVRALLLATAVSPGPAGPPGSRAAPPSAASQRPRSRRDRSASH